MCFKILSILENNNIPLKAINYVSYVGSSGVTVNETDILMKQINYNH